MPAATLSWSLAPCSTSDLVALAEAWILRHPCAWAQVCEAVCPDVPEAEYQLQLQVAHTQEDYIRGRLPHNPYLGSETGPLMRDVKNFICTQLDMAGERQWRLQTKLMACCT